MQSQWDPHKLVLPVLTVRKGHEMSYLQLHQLLANSFQTRTQRFADGACDDPWGAATLCHQPSANLTRNHTLKKFLVYCCRTRFTAARISQHIYAFIRMGLPNISTAVIICIHAGLKSVCSSNSFETSSRGFSSWLIMMIHADALGSQKLCAVASNLTQRRLMIYWTGDQETPSSCAVIVFLFFHLFYSFICVTCHISLCGFAGRSLKPQNNHIVSASAKKCNSKTVKMSSFIALHSCSVSMHFTSVMYYSYLY